MRWQISKNQPLLLSYMTVAGVIVMVVSLLLQGPVLFFAGTSFVILGTAPFLYLNYLSKRIIYQNALLRKRVMVREAGGLGFSLHNDSFLPLVYGESRIEFDDHLEIPEFSEGKRTVFIAPFNISRRGGVTLKVPFIAKKRGWVRAKSLKVVIQDPLRLCSFTLTYPGLLHTEVIIYPELYPLPLLKDMVMFREGASPQQTSLFADRTLVTGTREYEMTDPLKYVHWKASARIGQMQTKVFEKVSGIYWTLILILDSGQSNFISTERLEKMLSMATYMTQFAEKHQIAFDLYINIKSKGSSGGTYLGMEQGLKHLMKAWEMLAVIELSYIRIHPDNAWGFIDRQMFSPRIIFICLADSQSGYRPYLKTWAKRGHQLYQVKDNGAILGLSSLSSKDKGKGEALA